MFRRKSKFQSILESRFKHLKSYIRNNGLEGLVDSIVADGLEAHIKDIYEGKLGDSEERAFFFYYAMNQVMVQYKFRLGAEMHRNFIIEMVKCGNFESLPVFLSVAAKPKAGAFSYAAEICIDELKKQIQECEDPGNRASLEATLSGFTAAYEGNKKELQENWDYLQTLEEYAALKAWFFKAALHVLASAVVIAAAWLTAKFLI